jgi:transcriptional regulator with XRE-family HTH domain
MNYVRIKREFDTKIGAKLKELRTFLGISRVELGKSIGVTYQSVQGYETGKRNLTLYRFMLICKKLGVRASHLFREFEKDTTTEDKDV